MAGKPSRERRGGEKTTPVKTKAMKASASRGDASASAPNSPSGRGTPKRATATAANVKMKKIAKRNEKDDDDDDDDDDDENVVVKLEDPKANAKDARGAGKCKEGDDKCAAEGTVLGAWANDDDVWEEIRRVLKKGRIAVIRNFLSDADADKVHPCPPRVPYFPPHAQPRGD